MTGILIDATKLNKAQRDLSAEFRRVAHEFPGTLEELKGAKLIARKGGWRQFSIDAWVSIVDSLCSFTSDKSYSIVLAAIDRQKHRRSSMNGVPDCLQDAWLAAGLHIALQIQHKHKKTPRNKGNTFLIIDDNKKKADNFADLLWNPPTWSDDYYGGFVKKGTRLDQIINTPFTIKSQHEGLVQLADVYAAILRRYVELQEDDATESREGEREQVNLWAKQLAGSFIPKSHRWPARPKVQSAAWYNSVAPLALMDLSD